MLALIVALAFGINTQNVVIGEDINMTLNDACAQVVQESGYTNFHDLSVNVFPTEEYRNACYALD